MKRAQPPGFATWLVQHFGSSFDNDAMLGDLAERYREGKRPSWYWKQSLIAIVVSSFEDIRARKVLALRALLAGCMVHAGIEFWIARYLPLVPYWVPVSWWGSDLEVMIVAPFGVILGLIVGATIVRLYQGRTAIVLFYIVIVQTAGAVTVAISANGLAFYLVAGISLTLGILAGGFWSSRTNRAKQIVSK